MTLGKKCSVTFSFFWVTLQNSSQFFKSNALNGVNIPMQHTKQGQGMISIQNISLAFSYFYLFGAQIFMRVSMGLIV